ncbi:MAG TPA: peptidyl-prolyl cis-trans isomerase [Polyangiaceae bacterium]|jgi:parvulin-like peptidyl-prolyl isomerase|nr:peptidyl-prolyl cis-trans isomerase [Polyangiaceae bacterium]
MWSPLARWSAVLVVALGFGCNEKALQRSTRSDAGRLPGGLSPEQAALVVAKVGDRTITLGDYAATLERMDQFDRLRYQSPERRKELLQEIIDVELLAQDARKRKLDEEPETQQAIRQVLRDAILADAKRELPAPADIPEAEVRAYYEAHRDDYREPERRRVAEIVVKDKDTASKVIGLAKKTNSREWGELFRSHSAVPLRKGPEGQPLEMAGDLGLVGPPGDPRGDNPRVAAEVRAAVFEMTEIGDVLSRPVQASDGFHVVRMLGKSDAHERSLSDADRSIRVALLQARIAEREKALEAELRRQFPVTIDEQALAKVELPPPPEAPRDHGRYGDTETAPRRKGPRRAEPPSLR